MKYLITGASGFIGKHIVARLWQQGCEVECMRHSLSTPSSLEADIIIHLAAYGNHSIQQDIAGIMSVNVVSLIKILNALNKHPYQKFYNISSSSVTLPVKTFYSISKQAGEDICNLYAAMYDKQIVNIRPYSVYGPGEAAHRFIPTVIRALQTGDQIQLDEYATHDWIFVEDFIEAMFSGHTDIGTGESFTNLQVVEMLEEISGKKLNYQAAVLRVYDNPDWRCKVGVPHRSLYEGLKQTYESFTR